MEAAIPAFAPQGVPASQGRTVKVLLLLTRFLDQAGYTIFIPCIPFYAKRFGISPFEMGLILALFPLMQFFFSPVIGAWSDRIGRRPVLLICGAGLLLCNGTFACCTTMTVFALTRLLGGIFAGMTAMANSSICDVTSPAERTKGMALIGAGTAIGFLFAPPLGAFLDSRGHTLPAIAAAAFTAIYLAALFFLFPETHRHLEDAAPEGREPFGAHMKEGLRIVLRSPFLLLCMLLVLTYGRAAILWEGSLGYYITGTYHGAGSERLYAYMLCFTAVVSLVIQLFVLQRMKLHLREVRLVQWAVFAELAGLVIFSMQASLALLFVGLFLVASAYAIVPPLSMSLISLHTPQKNQGLVLGVAQSMSFFNKIVGIPMATAYFDVHPALPFRMAGTHAAAALVIVSVLAAMQLRKADRPPAGET